MTLSSGRNFYLRMCESRMFYLCFCILVKDVFGVIWCKGVCPQEPLSLLLTLSSTIFVEFDWKVKELLADDIQIMSFDECFYFLQADDRMT